MVLQGEAAGPYRGPDRRGRNEGAFAPIASGHVIVAALAVAIGAGAFVVFLVPSHPAGTKIGIYGVVAAALVFLGTGGVCLVAWKIAGRAAYGWTGSALVLLGTQLLVADGLSRFGVAPAPQVRPADELIALGIAGVLACRGLLDAEVNAGFSPLVTLCWSSALGLFLMGALNAAQANGLLRQGGFARAALIILGLGATLTWMGVALLGARPSTRGRHGASAWRLAAAALFAAASVFRALPPLHWASTIGSAGILFTAAALGAGVSLGKLHGLLKGRERAQRITQLTMSENLQRAMSDRQDLEEWLHDIRNAVAGLRAADAVLHGDFRHAWRGQVELADAVTAELARLHALVDPARQLQITNLELAGVLEPLVVAERAAGARVSVHLQASSVLADRWALARVLQNVLINARRYAPGTPVDITAVPVADNVEIFVRDGGPGMAPGEHTLAFERGGRGAGGSGVPGHGLGLYVARTLMGAMNGDVRLEAESTPGCCVVLSLPAAEAPSARHGTHVLEPWAPPATELRPAV